MLLILEKETYRIIDKSQVYRYRDSQLMIQSFDRFVDADIRLSAECSENCQLNINADKRMIHCTLHNCCECGDNIHGLEFTNYYTTNGKLLLCNNCAPAVIYNTSAKLCANCDSVFHVFHTCCECGRKLGVRVIADMLGVALKDKAPGKYELYYRTDGGTAFEDYCTLTVEKHPEGIISYEIEDYRGNTEETIRECNLMYCHKI